MKCLRNQRRLNIFYRIYEKWLNEEPVFNIFHVKSPKPNSSDSVFDKSNSGRPTKRFKESSTKMKKRKIHSLLEEYNDVLQSFSAELKMRACGKGDTDNLTQEVSTASRARATTYKEARR